MNADDLVLSTRTLRGAGFHARVEAAAASGWRFIGIDERDYAAALQEGLDDDGIVRLLSAHGVAVSEVEMLGDWAHGGERGRRSRALEEHLLGIATTFGAHRLNVGRDVEGSPDHVARRLAELGRRAAAQGVLVALEFMPFTNIADIAAAWRLVRAADEPGVGILLDTWHLRRAGTTDAQLREIPADRIVSVQLADTGPRPWPDLRQEALTDRRLPGEGAGELAALLAVLDEHGVRAPVSVEVMSHAMEALPPTVAAARAMRAARSVFRGWSQTVHRNPSGGLTPIESVRSIEPQSNRNAADQLLLPRAVEEPSMSTWSLASVQVEGGGAPRVAALVAGRAVTVPVLDGLDDLDDVLAAWGEVEPALRAFDPAGGAPIAGARVLAPLRSPRKLICAGANYVDHLREMGIPELPAGLEPYFFLLPPTSIAGPGDPVVIPADPGARVDWEAELAVVIGRAGRDIPEDRALEHVAGYTIMNDVSARGYHGRRNPLAPPFAFDWLGSKGRDTFSPMGPGITPAWLVEDPQDLAVRLWRNDELEQDGSTRDMIFPVARLISAASAVMTLEPGDVIATGTPAGVGVAQGKALADADVLRIEIGALGALENAVRVESRVPVATTR